MLTGAADAITGPAALAGLDRHADEARTAVVERAGHFVPEERPDAVAAELRAHLRAA
jgi:pimeloyl-ACP methyl ester carboxylesterase